MLPLDLEFAMEVAGQAAQAGSQAALRHFRTDLQIDRKPDASFVTAADRAAEAAIFSVLRDAFPDHALLGEESGEHEGDSDLRWIVDPLDGTHGFTRGEAHWGPLIALEQAGEILVGALAVPVLGIGIRAARGQGCWRDAHRLRVSGQDRWSEATLSLGSVGPLLSPPCGPAVAELARTAARTRAPGDLASFVMVLEGQAEVCLETGVSVWDLAPMPVLVEEAGGRFSNFDGGQELDPGSAVVSNGLLHEQVLRALSASR